MPNRGICTYIPTSRTTGGRGLDDVHMTNIHVHIRGDHGRWNCSQLKGMPDDFRSAWNGENVRQVLRAFLGVRYFFHAQAHTYPRIW